MLPSLDVAALRHYCEQRVPPHAIEQLRVELVESRGAVTIVERRPPWREDFGPERTLDAIHLEAAVELHTRGEIDAVLTYDHQLHGGCAHHAVPVQAPVAT